MFDRADLSDEIDPNSRVRNESILDLFIGVLSRQSLISGLQLVHHRGFLRRHLHLLLQIIILHGVPFPGLLRVGRLSVHQPV